MSLTVRLLGTSAARPTVERSVSSVAIIREGETLLFDCGEGTQRQMMRYGISFALDEVFFTHFHLDHLLGIVGLLRTLSLQGRTEPLRCYGPRGAERQLRRAESFGADRLTFPVHITECAPGDELKRKDYRLCAIEADHRGATALGWALIEDMRLGRFDPDRAKALGVPEGPLWGRLHRGETVTLADGTSVSPETLVGAARTGRRVVLSGDTRPCQAMLDAARNADLLVHEATFGDEEAERARETGHSTAREAAELAHQAGVKRLVLTHLSARYTRDNAELEAEARSVYPGAIIGRDGMEIELPYETM